MRRCLRRWYYKKLAKEIKGTVLDVGCGNSSVLQHLDVKSSTGVDAYAPWLEESRHKAIHDEYICADLCKFDTQKHYDTVISFDVVEHLEKQHSVKLVERMERWADNVLIVTPSGYAPGAESHVEDFTGDDDYHLELLSHKCYWTAAEFRKRGYTVRGMDGLRCLRKYDDGQRGKFLFWISRVSYLITYPFPEIAFRMMAIKKRTK